MYASFSCDERFLVLSGFMFILASVVAAVAVFKRRSFSWYLLGMKYEHKYFSLYLWHAKSQHKEYLRALHPDNGNEQQPKNNPPIRRSGSSLTSMQNATPQITAKKIKRASGKK